MENWGLITYRLTSMLYDPLTSSDSNKQWVSVVVAHELAHQWFGNLVTMKWWNDLWLNEGFASFVENIGASHDNPQWKMMDQFLLDKAQLAMNLDQMSNSHPISVPVHNPSEINALFDTISYDKGASIIRMLRSIIGKEAFRHGLQNYLETYKFGNAETKDLWGKLSKAWQVSDTNARDISTIMDTWTLQMGYPVVNITRDNNQLTAAQQHFLIHPREKPALVSPYGYKWEIPLTYSTQVDKQELYVWMGKDGKDVVINLPAQSGWFKANYGQKGFYRVNYDKENWEALTQQLKADHTALSDADRSGLIDDAFSLARAGQLKLQTALELTLYLTKEKEYVPWTSALNNLGYIHSMLCTDDAPFNTMKKYLLQQLSPIVEELGWQDEGTHLQKYLRASALKSAVEYGHENAKNEAMRIFNEWKNSGKRIAPNLRAIIYSIGVQHGGKENYDFVFKQYKTATVASEKRKLMYALSSSEDLTVLQDLLDKSLDSAVVRSQDSVAVINAVAGNCKGRFLAWNFTKQHWGLLYKRYAAGSFDFSRLVLRTTSHFNTQIMLNEVKSFFNTHPLGSGKRASKQSLESIQANIDWMERNKDTAVNWMGANTLMTPIEDVEKTLQQLEHINPNMADHEDRGYARNDYYYQDREEPRYGSDDYYRETGDNYRYEYR